MAVVNHHRKPALIKLVARVGVAHHCLKAQSIADVPTETAVQGGVLVAVFVLQLGVLKAGVKAVGVGVGRRDIVIEAVVGAAHAGVVALAGVAAALGRQVNLAAFIRAAGGNV